MVCLSHREQVAGPGSEAGTEEEQEEGLLQDTRSRQDRHGRRDQEGLQEEGARTSPR